MTGALWEMAGGAVMWSLIGAGIWIDRRLTARKARHAAAPKPPGPWTSPAPGPVREPVPRLDPDEFAALAALAIGRAGKDPRPARYLANYLRERCPGISDIDVMRVMRALGAVAHVFRRNEPGEAAAFEAFLSAIAGAALELTEVERMDAPR